MPELTAERLRELLDYDPASGEFANRTRRAIHSKIGAKAGCVAANGYVYIGVDRGRYTAHRLAWLHVTGEWPNGHIDHLNGVRTDNRIANLRVVTNAVNCQNKRDPLPSNSSGLLGVGWDKQRKLWRAQIQINGMNKFLGRRKTPEEAQQLYLAAKRRLHEGCTI